MMSKEDSIITDNGIRIKGDLSALSRLKQSDNVKRGKSVKPKNIESKGTANSLLDTSIKEKKQTIKEKKKELKKINKRLKQIKKTKEETEAEKIRKAEAQKRIEQYHNNIIKHSSSSHSSFKVMQKREWILDWNCVMFKNGYMVIYAHSNSGVKFTPQKSYISGLLESYNYLKKYLNDRLPPIRCEIQGMQLRIIDNINFSEALQQFARAARQGGIETGKNGPSTIGSPLPMSFSQALSKAKQMTPEDFQKYKSKYIDYLVTLQSSNYKVIPCVERLAHANSDNTEYAFLFSIECSSGKILIVHENVNPDRSTLLFLIEKNSYDRSIMSIYDFLQSAEINKRSSIRERSISYHDGIIDYKSINHDDLSSWKRAIEWYFKIAINIPRKRIDITKMKFTSFNQLLKGIQADDNYKEVQPILEKYGIPTNRKLKPADILERIPNSICTIDKDGRKILPIPNGQWTLEKIIKLIKYC